MKSAVYAVILLAFGQACADSRATVEAGATRSSLTGSISYSLNVNTPPVAGAALDANGLLDVFALGTDHRVWRNQQTAPTTWTGFAATVPPSTSFLASSAVSVTAEQDGRLELFARGMDNSIWHTRETALNGSFAAWSPLPTSVANSPPASVIRSDGLIDVYAVGFDGTVWHSVQNGVNAPTYSAWTAVDTSTLPNGFGPIVVRGDLALHAGTNGNVSVYMRWADGSCRSATVSAAGTATWLNLGGTMVGNPAVSRDGSKIYALGTDWKLWSSPSSGGLVWSPLGTPSPSVTFASSPVIASTGGIADEVFLVGSDRVTYTWYSTATTAQWGTLGGTASAGLFAVYKAGAMEVFARGQSGTVFRNEGTGGTVSSPRTWTGYQSLGGAAALASQDPSDTPVQVLTHKNDAGRTGNNQAETILNTSNVNVTEFGHQFDLPVDGQVYAEPLYVSNVNVPGVGVRNLLIVATSKNKVYAWDADTDPGTTPHPYWMQDFATYSTPEFPVPSPNPDFGTAINCLTNIRPWIGITSTPVVDPSTNTVYVEAFSGIDANFSSPQPITRDLILEPEKNNQCAAFRSHFDGCHIYRHRLHALDLATGSEKMSGPVTLTGTVNATGMGSVAGTLTLAENSCSHGQTQAQYFSRQQIQRAALLLSHGVVYTAFGANADQLPYHGWVLGRSAANLTLAGGTTPFVSARNDAGGGIWQAGSGLAGDGAGFVYAMSGNGFDRNGASAVGTQHQGPYWAEAFLKLAPTLGATQPGSFIDPAPDGSCNGAPTAACDDQRDDDLGSSGPLLIPGTTTLIGGGKEGFLYSLDTASMSINQKFSATYEPDQGTRACPRSFNPSHIHGSPVFWSGPVGNWIYVWGEQDYLKAFALNADGTVATGTNPLAPGWCGSSPALCGALASYSLEESGCRMPGGMLTISSNGSLAGSGIVWANHHDSDAEEFSIDANTSSTLMAFDASDLHKSLWRSAANPADPGNPTASHDNADVIPAVSKNAPVTVANGRVYVATAPTLFNPSQNGQPRRPADNGQVRVYGLKNNLR